MFRRALLAAVGALTLATAARADLMPFATFEQASVNPAYEFINNSKKKTFGFLSKKVNVTFQFLVDNGYGEAKKNIAAVETITAYAKSTATDITVDGSKVDVQFMKQVTFTITAKKPVDGKSLLLQITDSTGTIAGVDGGNTARFFGSTTTKDTVTFSSDFLDFSKTKDRAYQLNLLGVDPGISIDKDEYLAAFKAGVNAIQEGKPTATFSADVAPTKVAPKAEPEPSTLALGAFGAAGLVARHRLRRRADRSTAT
jgi:hypothetical protein